MLQTMPRKNISLTRLFAATVIVSAILMASCCPPALLDRAPKKAGEPAQVEKAKP